MTAALYAGFAAIAGAFSAIGRSSPTVVEPVSDDFVFYTLDVAFTPYGLEILSFWMPTSIAKTPASEMRKGDLE